MVSMTHYDGETRYAEFVADYDNELSKMPDMVNRGKDNLSSIYGVCMGSICRITTTGNIYTLVGDGNYWKLMN